MHFQHPELLYALFLLLIPLLVHLFRLRKFRKEKFTNVKFLRKVSEQKRQSSRIKKWLILCTRLLLLAAVILAFAQPYFPSETGRSGAAQETVIYLDNSYSMQAKGSSGILLKRAVQELLENLPPESPFSIFTNDVEFRNVTAETVTKDLQQITYSPNQLDWQAVLLKAQNIFQGNENTLKNFIAISDFQKLSESEGFLFPEEFKTRMARLQPEKTTNISIDTAYVSAKTLDETTLLTEISALGAPSLEFPVSLYNGEQLIAKKTAVLRENLRSQVEFNLPAGEFSRGRIEINDVGLPFDNRLFFSINKSEPIKVVVINNSDASFLKRIYKAPDFDVSSFPENQVNYNALADANLIVLNELKQISSPLAGTLRSLLQEDAYLIVIPSSEAEIESYNAFFRENGLPEFRERIDEEKLISNISYNHPLYETVFNEEVHNFEYPKVQRYYRINGRENPVLSYENGEPFLFQEGNSYVFTAPLNTEDSNFQMAPLIVPTLYNVGNMALNTSTLYHILGNQVTVDVPVSVGRDEILSVVSPGYQFIPRQQNFQNKVELHFGEAPEKAGTYTISKDDQALGTISFNIDRSENNLDYTNLEPSQNSTVHNSVSEVFRKMEAENEVNALWKWFVIFGFLMLLTEMLILKYYK